MNTFSEFFQQAREAFPGYTVKAGIDQLTTDTSNTPRYQVVVLEDDDCARGEGQTPQEAIDRCRQKQAQQRHDKIEAAKKLLESIG